MDELILLSVKAFELIFSQTFIRRRAAGKLKISLIAPLPETTELDGCMCVKMNVIFQNHSLSAQSGGWVRPSSE